MALVLCFLLLPGDLLTLRVTGKGPWKSRKKMKNVSEIYFRKKKTWKMVQASPVVTESGGASTGMGAVMLW